MGATNAAKVAATVRVTIKKTNARPPIRPIVLASGADVTPTMMLPTTSGITVILMALIQSVPNGSIRGTRPASVGDPDLEMPMPRARPAPSAMSTFVVRDTRPNYAASRAGASRHAHHYRNRRVKTAPELIAEAKARVTEVTPQETMAIQAAHPGTVLLDCREPNEYNLGHITGALFIPRGTLETNIEAAVPRTAKVVIYCASGNRSAFAADTLQQMGYTDVASMSGGFRGWVEAGGEVDD